MTEQIQNALSSAKLAMSEDRYKDARKQAGEVKKMAMDAEAWHLVSQALQLDGTASQLLKDYPNFVQTRIYGTAFDVWRSRQHGGMNLNLAQQMNDLNTTDFQEASAIIDIKSQVQLLEEVGAFIHTDFKHEQIDEFVKDLVKKHTT